MTEDDKQKIRDQLEALKQEHRDLDEAIHHMPRTIHTQDEIIKLENLLLPDILA